MNQTSHSVVDIDVGGDIHGEADVHIVGDSDTASDVHVVDDFALESGTVLRGVRQFYRLDGELNAARDNLVLVFHALTGSADAAGDWWRDLIGPGRALDTRRHAVLCANLLGSCYGTTWDAADRPSVGEPSNPSNDVGERPNPSNGARPSAHAAAPGDIAIAPPDITITPRDMARLIGRLLDHLGVDSVALAVGGSLGGMVALEWAATFPDRARAVIAIAAPAAHTAFGIALNHLQRTALELDEAVRPDRATPPARGSDGAEPSSSAHEHAPSAGLALARMVGMISYRTPAEFEHRFGRDRRDDGRFQIQSYLDHHGRKLVDRFDPRAYRTLIDAMDAHDVGRGRGGIRSALEAFQGRLVGVGIPGDLLYPAETVRAWTDAAKAEYREIHSIHGHDAFLIETDQVAAIIDEVLGRDAPSRSHGEVADAPRNHSLRIALAGCGTVGAAFVQLLEERGPDIERRLGVRFEIARVLVRDPDRERGLALPPGTLTDDPELFLEAEADLLVEALGGLEPARTLARATLERGGDVVTANKLLIAADGPNLARIAAHTNARLAFEAAVGGGAPVVRTLLDASGPADARTIRGILNGTTNFVLSAMADGAGFEEALSEARRLGLAEADATRDLDGRDVEDKIRILAWLAFGVEPGAVEVERQGLLPDPEVHVRRALEGGGVPRLVAECSRAAGGVRAVIEPRTVPAMSPFGRASGEENVVEIETRWSGTLRVSGPGAGGAPTASALLSEVIELARAR